MLRALLEATMRAKEEDNAVFGGEIADPVFKGLDRVDPAPVARPSEPILSEPMRPTLSRRAMGLREVFDLWQAENKPRDRTASDFATQMGHAHDDIAEEYGLDEEGWGISLPVLDQAMRRLDYPAELRTLLDAIR